MEAILKMSQVRSIQSIGSKDSSSNTNALEDTAYQNNNVPPHYLFSTLASKRNSTSWKQSNI